MAINTDKEYIEAKNYALRLLTYRPRSESELVTKLKQKNYRNEIIDSVVELMKEYNYVNDREFAAQWVEHRLSGRPMGSILIKHELKKFGIDKEIIAEVTAGIDRETEIQLAKSLAIKKISIGGKISVRNISGLLQRRGFPYDVVRKVLSDLNLL